MDDSRTQFLQALKQDDLSNDVPSVSEAVAQFLHEQAQSLSAKSILEIGTAHGYSTIWLADVVEKNQGHLHTIDVSAPSFAIAVANVKAVGLDHCVSHHFGNAKDLLPTVDTTFDLIFIDARKRDTHTFFELCAPKLNPNGIIIVDDVEKFKEKMQPFWNYITHQTDWEYKTLPLDADDSIMVIRKSTLGVQGTPSV